MCVSFTVRSFFDLWLIIIGSVAHYHQIETAQKSVPDCFASSARTILIEAQTVAASITVVTHHLTETESSTHKQNNHSIHTHQISIACMIRTFIAYDDDGSDRETDAVRCICQILLQYTRFMYNCMGWRALFPRQYFTIFYTGHANEIVFGLFVRFWLERHQLQIICLHE